MSEPAVVVCNRRPIADDTADRKLRACAGKQQKSNEHDQGSSLGVGRARVWHGLRGLPTSTRVATRNDVLDTFGCLLGGSGAPGIAELARVVGGWGGVPQSQVMLWQLRLPAPQAAMINASMAHALDFDDTLDHGGSIHPGASVLAASLAVSDMLGGVSGQRLLLGIAPASMCLAVWRSPRRSIAVGIAPLQWACSAPLCRRQAARLECGADGECAWDRIQPGRRESPVHRGWRADQAPSGRSGSKQRRARRAAGQRGLHRCPQHLPGPLWFFRAVPAQWSRSGETARGPGWRGENSAAIS